MPHPAQPAAPPSPPRTRTARSLPRPAARTAPYALVRTTVTPHPAEPAPAAEVRRLLERLTGLEARAQALREPLCDDLFASRADHDEDFHRTVVLPLRRALHNDRIPRPALLDRLRDLPARVPRLGEWLALLVQRASLYEQFEATCPGALAAERAALAEVCRTPAFGRAIALSSADLLRAVTRAAGGEGGRRARKEEPSLLRHALRAGTKTSPLSWFTAVGWHTGDGLQIPHSATQFIDHSSLRPVVRENRTLVGALVAALLDEPRRRRALPHRMSSGAAPAGEGRVRFSRDLTLFAGGRYLVTREDEVELADRPALASLAAVAATPAPLDDLAASLARALGRPGDDPALRRYLDQAADGGLLVPVDPVPPQHPEPLAELASWLRRWPQDAGLADRIDALSDDTVRFADLPSGERPAHLADLADRWRTLLADAGRPVPADAAPLNVLSEDVVDDAGIGARAPGLTADDRDALAELTALAELFDLGHLMRRVALDRFTARYGHGGVCTAPWEFGAETAGAWQEAVRLSGLPADDPALPAAIADIARLRAEFAARVRTAAASSDHAGSDVVLPADAVRALAGRLPGWTAARPLSYAWFVQRAEPGARLAVNHVYGGWGRFTSRFLDGLGDGAAAEVARQIHDGLGPGARAAQVRPVGGFNANLHPLLVGSEIGPDRHGTDLAEADTELFHDTATDQLRIRLRATGEQLDVLYLGFLAPVMLPQRLAPFLCDHPGGIVDFRSLLPRTRQAVPGGEVVRTPRLLHRHLVLARRRWHLPEPVVAALRADLAAGTGEVPAAAVAKWRALLGLPDRLFLHAVPRAPVGDALEDFVSTLRAPKPQALDLGSALHLRCLPAWLARHPRGIVLEEALPAFGGSEHPTHAVELVAETYRPARTSGLGEAPVAGPHTRHVPAPNPIRPGGPR
ncbi:lantibiotic dehydratase [Streptomyces sp. NPDC001941]|uniref:lantibiotic dehydratase n=1 Tax=Streptomyces sp. NPDC001941 TaxID=3154659 RepID=UPI0033184B3A